MQIAIATNSASALRDRNPSLTFIVGQDRKGHWIALETHGLRGGIFASKEAAMDYAEFETGYRTGAVRVIAKPIELTVWTLACAEGVRKMLLIPPSLRLDLLDPRE